MKIGIVGAGFIGRALARLATQAGHEVMIANSRDPRTLGSTAVALGCATGTAEEAARFGDIVVVTIPFSAVSALDPKPYVGKVVIDTCNHYPARDGENAALDANEVSTGELLARHLAGARVVKAFNAILQGDLDTDPRPSGAPNRRALPIAGDDAEARAIVSRLQDEWGFDTVDAGPMSESWRFERGKPGYCIHLNRADMEKALAAAEKGVSAPTGSWRRAAASKAQAAEHRLSGRGSHDIVDGQFHLGPAQGIHGTMVAMDALGIRSLIVDEVWHHADGKSRPAVELENGHIRPLTVLGVEASIVHPERFAFVQRVSRHDPGLLQYVPMVAEMPGCRGLRMVLSSRAERDALGAGEWDKVFGLATDLDLPVCFLSAQLPDLVAPILDKFPGLSLVIDHCGWCRSPEEWEKVLSLSDLPGTVLKWSHPARTFGRFDDPAHAEVKGLTDAVAAFGADRIFWASDATFEETGRSWADSLAAITYHPTLDEADRSAILGGTARRVFGWSIS